MDILIIDDEKLILDFFARLARARGWQGIDMAGTGEEALTLVLRKEYDLITVDLQMPGIGGLEIVAMLRNMNPRSVICIVSGYLPDNLSADVTACIDLALPKPLSTETFNALLDGATVLRQARAQIRALGQKEQGL